MTDPAPEAAEKPAAEEVRLPVPEAELLSILKSERSGSIGFDEDEELTAKRKASLNYYKGVMDDVPSLPNRSKAVDGTVAEVVDTLLPNLMEIFAGGDDVATFRPRGPEDEDGAQQETDYVNHVVFEENPGWLVLATAFKDALLCNLGVFSWWWENAPEDAWECFKGKTQDEVAAILQAQGGANQLLAEGRLTATPSQTDGDEPLWDVEIKKQGPDGRIRIAAWPAEDFTVARDTVVLADATYCAGRSRPRAQELIAEGIEREKIDRLPPDPGTNDTIERARDNAGEQSQNYGGDAKKDMRQVEVTCHFIRLLVEDDLQLWKVRTGADETVLLDAERVDRIHFDTITPDIAAHRLYGRSIYDIVGEIARIKTALKRGWLDSIYFGLSPRHYIDMQKVNEFTLADLLNNQPMHPVRGNGEAAVTALQQPTIRADVFATGLEYFDVQTERATGVTRNAQGLNPDTLHDTAKGAELLMTAAQKRERMVARIFAETGVKGLFLGVHALLRQHASKQQVVRLRGKWTPIDPTTWGERNDMTIEIGLGSSGRAQDVVNFRTILDLQERAAANPMTAALVTPANIYAAGKGLIDKMGVRGAERFITDPSTVPPQPPQPHPEVLKAQAKAQGDAAKAQVDGQVKMATAQQDAQLEAQVAQGKLALQQEQMDRETDLKQQEILMSARVEAMKAHMGHAASLARVEYGGAPG